VFETAASGNSLEISHTIEELLDGKIFDIPPTNIAFAQAQRVQPVANQGELL